MSREDKTVRVLDVAGEVMRFRVESWTDKRHPHLVDLLANGGAGQCSCKDWGTRRWPLIRDAAAKGHAWPRLPDLFCRHVIAARQHFLNQLLATMSREHGNRE